jgi:hypothetical protein
MGTSLRFVGGASQLLSASRSSKLRTLVEQQRAVENRNAAADVEALSDWEPRPPEAVLFASAVVGRYRTTQSNGINHNLWDLALEQPIARDERVRAEMAKIFEAGGDPETTAGVSSQGTTSGQVSSLDWARRLGDL